MAWLNSSRRTCLAGRLLLSSWAEEPPREPPLLLLRRKRLVMAGRLARGHGGCGPGCGVAGAHRPLVTGRCPGGWWGAWAGGGGPAPRGRRHRASAPGTLQHPPTCGGERGESHLRDGAPGDVARSPGSTADVRFNSRRLTASSWDPAIPAARLACRSLDAPCQVLYKQNAR